MHVNPNVAKNNDCYDVEMKSDIFMTKQSNINYLYPRSYFEFFSIPETFAIDETLLTSEYLKQQKKLHPDSDGDFKASSYVNNAYNVLIDPVKRAEYMLELNSINLDKVSCSYANDMFNIRENYDIITDVKEKLKFKQKLELLFLQNTKNLETIDISSNDFKDILLFLQFIQAFLEKVKDDVNSRY